MIGNYFLLYLSGISCHFIASTVAREAILNGFPVHTNAFPYQVSVQILGYGHVCGGGIIDNQFILTAAHCIVNRTRHLLNNHISVVAGTNYLDKTGPPAVTIRVDKVFFPKEFHPTAAYSHGDIAVLRLADSLQIERRANLRNLQLAHSYQSEVKVGTIAGFGWQVYNRTARGSTGNSNGHLSFICPDVLSEHQCEKGHPHDAIESLIHLCARLPLAFFQGRSGACIGDTGGPLVQLGRVVIGILSKIAPHCDERRVSGVYTRVAHYVPMIINAMDRGHDANLITLHI